MGLMFSRRRMDAAKERAAAKARAQSERHSEAKARHLKGDKDDAPKGGKDGADSKGTK